MLLWVNSAGSVCLGRIALFWPNRPYAKSKRNLEETANNTGAVPKEVSTDAGYYSAKAVDGLYNLGEDPPRLGAATGTPWPHTQGTVRQGPDAPQAADETGT